MKKQGAVAAVLVAGVILLPAVLIAAESSTSPPKNLKLVGDHWTPWDPPEPGPDDYIIVKGDTLWDLAGKWFGDPFLWPQIWDKNRYILDSHWIYPGDPLVVPGRPTVVPPGGPPMVEEEEAPTPQPEPTKVEAIEPEPLLLLADRADLHCSGYIEPDRIPSDLTIAGKDLEGELIGQGDVVYLDQGRSGGVLPGSVWTVIRESHTVSHPATEERIGSLVRRLGKARVLLAREDGATAVIEESCDTIATGDELVPWMEIPAPRMAVIPSFDALDVTPSGGPVGTIVEVKDRVLAVGAGHVIHTDLGTGAGVRPGDVLALYRERGGVAMPRATLGQAIILTVERDTSTAKITRSVREIEIGDQVEVVR